MQSRNVVQKTLPQLPQRTKKTNAIWRFFGVWMMMAIAGTAAHAALPPAGTTIGNQAAATYTDGNGANRNATSNTVITVIQQVTGLNLIADRAKQGAPNGPVYFPHTVTNTGNGPDSYNLTAVENALAATGTFAVDQIFIYADANGDGVPDDFVPIALTPTLAAGASFSFVVAGHVPSTATAGQVGKVKVAATSTLPGQSPVATAINNDTVTVSNNAIINITKAIDNNVGSSKPTPTTHKYTLTYINNGVGAATSLIITDTLDSNLVYQTGTAKWSQKTGVLSEVAMSQPQTGNGAATIDYSVNGNIITATISNVAPGESGTISFDIKVVANIAPQVIPNSALFSYIPVIAGTRTIDQPTNTVNLTIKATAGVTGVSPAAQGPVPQGSTLYFDNKFTNTGTGTDTFDVTIDPLTTTPYPAGTTFTLYQAGGTAPLLDSNGNNIPDTGPVLAGADYHVFVQVTLPAGAANVAGVYTVDKTATSITDPTKNATVTDTLNGITPSTVDLMNGVSGILGQGALGATPITTLAGDPSTTVRFTLRTRNLSASPDNYDVLASGSSAFAPPTTLPSGVSVVFRNLTNGVITNTGNVLPDNAGHTNDVVYYADVTIPAGAAPVVAANIFFQTKSPNSGAVDKKLDAITINQVRAIAIEPNNTGQTYPGSSIVYSHIVTNNSNTTETINLATVDNSSGFTSLIYQDINNNRILDAGDPQITSLAGMLPGQSKNIFVKVFAPANAVPGNVDVATVTATTAAGPILTATATDTTTIVSSQLTLLKQQALDAEPNGTPDTAYSTSDITTGAKPGTGIRYKITVTNNSALPITNVVVNDSTPPYTTYYEPNATASATGRAAWTLNGTTFTAGTPIPTSGNSGVLVFTIGTLQPGQSATVYFGVKINQ